MPDGTRTRNRLRGEPKGRATDPGHDRTDPRRVLSRTETPVFAPEADWEKVGQVPNVVFVEGMVLHGGRWLFYYGGADKYVGVAEATAR